MRDYSELKRLQRTGQLGEPSLVYLLPKKRTPEEEDIGVTFYVHPVYTAAVSEMTPSAIKICMYDFFTYLLLVIS